MPLGHHVSEVRKRSVGSNTLLREHGPSTCTADGCVCARRRGRGPHTRCGGSTRTHWCYWEHTFCTHDVQARILTASGSIQPNSPGSYFTERVTGPQHSYVVGPSSRTFMQGHLLQVCSPTLRAWESCVRLYRDSLHWSRTCLASFTGSNGLVTFT